MKNHLHFLQHKTNRLVNKMKQDSRCNLKYTNAVEWIKYDIDYILNME